MSLPSKMWLLVLVAGLLVGCDDDDEVGTTDASASDIPLDRPLLYLIGFFAIPAGWQGTCV